MSEAVTETETLIVERDDRGVVTVTMNRPEVKNAANGTMWNELRQTWAELGEDPEVRVVVMTGAGDAFCAGADLSGQSNDQGHPLRSMHSITMTALQLHRIPQPTIARVNGVAVGAGCNIALGCDLVVASRSARFSEIFARRGLSVDFGGSWLLPRLVGLHRAKELALLADIVSAEEAAAMGLVNKVVEPDELDAAVEDWAGRLADGPPLALAMTKRLLNEGAGRSLEEALEAEGLAQAINLRSRDTTEAVAAFLEKREATFEGR